MKTFVCCSFVLTCVSVSAFAAEEVEPFLGRWALVLPNDGPGWLEVTQEKGYLDGSILWYGGSVVPLESVYVNEGTLYATRSRGVERKNEKGEVVRQQTFTETLAFAVSGDTLSGTRVVPRANGKGVDTETLTGKRIPPNPATPDLGGLKYGDSIVLFDGKGLDGWRLTDEHAVSGWRVEEGVLVNDPVQEEGKIHKHYGNLRTDREFEDFNLTLEVNVPAGGNSGIYLRGIYEVQVCDTFGQPLNPHNMGGIYSRITPSVAAEKPAGEWQAFDITLVDRHVTVKLNGQTIIDNAPLGGCTGGALWSDEFRPGPIYLQGDHTAVKYRDIVLKPIVREGGLR